MFIQKRLLLISTCFTLVSGAAYAGPGAGNTGGGCYNLQIIALKAKSADMSGTSGHSLFITQNARTRINLSEGPFSVLDRNGTDGTAAFSLPNPDPTNSGVTGYSVFMRLVGKPGSKIDMATCGTDATGAVYCSEQTVNMIRSKGGSSFQNVSQELLYVYADLDLDGDVERVPLFDSALQEYFWQVDSTGRLHAQLRFCPVSTVVAAP
ncbi:MAG: hypothetical protein SGJ18_03940 [Pseudomonadota bacterium]|nr:hypothetical protein [Pseudomonadota bacterium]